MEKDVFNAFIKQKIVFQKNTNDIVLVEEAVSQLKAIEYYELAFTERHNSDYFNRKMVADNVNFNAWPIDSLEMSILKTELLNLSGDSELKWKESDFEEIKLTISTHDKIKESISNGKASLNLIAFTISKPLISKNKKNALIYYNSYTYFTGGGTSNKLALLKKVNNQWVIIANFYDPRTMN